MTKTLGKTQGVATFAGNPEDVLNEAAIAQMLGCGPGAVSLLCKTGQIKAKRVGNAGWRATRRSVLAFLDCDLQAGV